MAIMVGLGLLQRLDVHLFLIVLDTGLLALAWACRRSTRRGFSGIDWIEVRPKPSGRARLNAA